MNRKWAKITILIASLPAITAALYMATMSFVNFNDQAPDAPGAAGGSGLLWLLGPPVLAGWIFVSFRIVDRGNALGGLLLGLIPTGLVAVEAARTFVR